MSSRNDELWARVNEALDAREDPFSDPAVVDVLHDEPDRALEVESLTRALETIRTLPRAEPAARRRAPARVRAAIAAALFVALAGLSYWAATRSAAPPAAPPPLRALDVVKAFPPDATAVASWSVRVERREAAVTTSDSLGSDGVHTTADTSTLESSADSACIVVHSFTRLP